MNKVLTIYHAKHQPVGFLFMMDEDDDRLGTDYLPVAVDCWFKPASSMLITEHGDYFHIDVTTWEASPIRFKKARKEII